MLVKDTRMVVNGVDITEHVEGPVEVKVSDPMKERALFYLTARLILLTELSCDSSQVRILPAEEMQNLEHKKELEVLQWLRDQVVEKL